MSEGQPSQIIDYPDVDYRNVVSKTILSEREVKIGQNRLWVGTSTSRFKKLHWLWEKLKRKQRERKLLSYLIPRILFAICSPLTATKGFFSIPALIVSLGAISFLAFFTAIPSFVITALVLINVAYCLAIEQPIYFRPFVILSKQIFGKTKKANYNVKTKRLVEQNEKLREKQGLPRFVPGKTNISLANKTSFLKRAVDYTRLAIAYGIAFFIVALRTIESSGRNTLGLMALVLLFTPTPASGFILLFTFTSIVGYCINNSQQFMQQIHETLKILVKFKIFDRKIYTKDDYDNKIDDQRVLLKFQSNIAADKSSSAKPNLVVGDPALAQKSASKWKRGLYYFINLCFWVGAAGTSTAAFFTINKFFKLMDGVAYLGFFALTPPHVAFALALIMTGYILFVEQRKILFPYFRSLFQGFLGTSDQKNKTPKDPLVKIANLQEKISATLKQLRESRPKNWQDVEEAQEWHELDEIDQEFANTYSNSIFDDTTYNYSKTRIFLTNIAATIILSLRAITSIGAPALGLDVALKTSLLFAAKLIGVSIAGFLGPWTFFPCLIIATLGYLIKFSRNAKDQWHETKAIIGRIKNPRNELAIKQQHSMYEKMYSRLMIKANQVTDSKIRFTKTPAEQTCNGKVLKFFKVSGVEFLSYNDSTGIQSKPKSKNKTAINPDDVRRACPSP